MPEEGGAKQPTNQPTSFSNHSVNRQLTFIQVGVGETSSQLLDDMDGLQVSGALQPHDGVHGQPGKVVLVVGEQFGGQRGACNV